MLYVAIRPVFEQMPEDAFVDAMVEKYRNEVVTSVTSFRDISKMARAERAGEDPEDVTPVLVRLITTPEMRIEDAFEETVRTAYAARGSSH